MSVWAEAAAVVVFARQLKHLNPVVDVLLPVYALLVALFVIAKIRSNNHNNSLNNSNGYGGKGDCLEAIVRRNMDTRRTSPNPAAVEDEISAVDLRDKPDFSGFWKRTACENEEQLMVAQGVAWPLRKIALTGDAFQRLAHTGSGLAIKQIKGTREQEMEYFYGKTVKEEVAFGDGHNECDIYWEGNVLIVSKYNPVTRLRFVGTRELSEDGNTIHSICHMWTKVDRDGDYFRGEGRNAMKGDFETHVVSPQVMERVPEPN